MGAHKAKIGVSLAIVLLGALIFSLGYVMGFYGKPRTRAQQVSYTIGAQFGRSLRNQDVKLDPRALARGMRDGLTQEQVALSEEEMQKALSQLNEDRNMEIKKVADKNRSVADDFLSRNRVADGVKTTRSGLQYRILQPGRGASPKDDDVVVVHYRATLVDGKEFDSSFKRNAPVEFPLRGVMPGWTEGLQLMKKGGKAMLYIPPELAYGDRPRQNIPPNSVLIFDVELVDVKPPGSIPNRSPSAPRHSK